MQKKKISLPHPAFQRGEGGGRSVSSRTKISLTRRLLRLFTSIKTRVGSSKEEVPNKREEMCLGVCVWEGGGVKGEVGDGLEHLFQGSTTTVVANMQKGVTVCKGDAQRANLSMMTSWLSMSSSIWVVVLRKDPRLAGLSSDFPDSFATLLISSSLSSLHLD